MKPAITSRLLQRAFGLERPETREVSVRRDVAVPMEDGVILLADHYAPRPLQLCAASPPVVLVRSPYGRRGIFAILYGRVLAERGLQVFIQSCRGTAGSGGEFVPQVNEQRDGIATVRWLRTQPWCEGTIASTGMSYLGYTQYATATHPEAEIAALALQVTMADLGEPTFSHGGFSFANTVSWVRTISGLQESRIGRLLPGSLNSRGRLEDGLAALPLSSADRLATGRTVGWYQDWLANPAAELPYWRRQSHRDAIPDIRSPVSMLTGWYDLFLPWMLRDYATLAAAGNPPELTIGPWRHGALGHGRAIPGETIRFLRDRLLGERSNRATPVRIYLTGDGGGWRDLPAWPPPTEEMTWHLEADRLVQRAATDGRSTTFTYDPADPTPSLGGPMLAERKPVVDNAEHEARPDVITFTSLALEQVLEVVGTVLVELAVSSAQPYHDVFVRLCEVDDRGRSWNVTDRITRLTEVDHSSGEIRKVALELWPCAHRFAPGHRLRLQVSAGAHPRYARNLGTGEDIAGATAMRTATITLHDAGSRIILPTSCAAAGSHSDGGARP